MSKIEAKSLVIVEQSIDKCFQYTCDPHHAQEWYSNVVESKMVDNPPLQVGTRAYLLTEIMGKNHDFNYIVTEYIPTEKIKMVAEDGTFPMECEYHFKALNENRTEITIINRASPSNVPFFLVGMIKSKVQQTMDQDILTLKSILEKR